MIAMTLFCSCADNMWEEDASSSLPDRTLIVYMGGDNNLSSETYDKIAAIQDKVGVLDRFSAPISSVILIYQDSRIQGARLWKVAYGQNEPQLLRDYSAENSASGEVFRRVVNDCISLAPARSYALWIFSHASGWLPSGTLNDPLGLPQERSVIVDGTDEMDIKDFARALPDGRFDFIVFEACFMASVEVMYELKDKARYIVASSAEILSPGFTEIYDKAFSKLFEGDIIGVAQAYFDHWNAQSGKFRSATISVVNTSTLDELAQLAAEIFSNKISVNILDLQHFDRNKSYRLFFDLKQYLDLQANERQRIKLERILSRTVMYGAATPYFLLQDRGFEIAYHSGLTTYVRQEKFSFLNSEYQKLGWAISQSVKRKYDGS